jgi:hypothetical protein
MDGTGISSDDRPRRRDHMLTLSLPLEGTSLLDHVRHPAHLSHR